jgi:hypothetical protein
MDIELDGVVVALIKSRAGGTFTWSNASVSIASVFVVSATSPGSESLMNGSPLVPATTASPASSSSGSGSLQFYGALLF